MPKLTHRGLQSLATGKWLSDGGARGGGTLVARKLASGKVLMYFRYTNVGGAREVITIGEWAGSGGTLSLEAARSRALALSDRYRNGERDLSAALESERWETRRRLQAEARAREDVLAREQSTLKALMNAYVADLRRRSKGSSASAVAAAVQRHIVEPWPHLAAKPADELDLQDLLIMVRRVVGQGKLNEARKLRSYLRAAYTSGINAQQDASASAELLALKIRANPARDLAPIAGASGAGNRNLTPKELRSYWCYIAAKRDNVGAALRFHLLTGAQRIRQLSRARLENVDFERGTLMLYDSKGRRAHAAPHLVPLTGPALDALRDMAAERMGDYIFTLTYGRSGIGDGDLSRKLRDVAGEMEKAGHLEHGLFTLADLRRTVETQLAAARVPRELRGQLQSHGRGGIQARHYDRHDYLDEKRETLELLYQLVAAERQTVTPLHAKVRRA